MNEKQKDILDGLILSDGSLEKSSNNANARLRFTLKHREFAENIIKVLNFLPWENNGKIRRRTYFDKRVKKELVSYQIKTRVNPLLNKFYEEWYSVKNKRISDNLNFSKEMILYWYLGDGFLGKKKSRPNYRRIGFCTDSFSVEENEFLADQLKKILNTKYIYLENTSKQNKNIMISRTGVTAFYELLGSTSPVSAYQYKFDFGQYKNREYLKNSYKTRKKKTKTRR